MYRTGSSALSPDFTGATLEAACEYVRLQNQSDSDGQIEPWNVGLPLYAVPGKSVVRPEDVEKSGPKGIQKEIKRLDEAIKMAPTTDEVRFVALGLRPNLLDSEVLFQGASGIYRDDTAHPKEIILYSYIYLLLCVS